MIISKLWISQLKGYLENFLYKILEFGVKAYLQ